KILDTHQEVESYMEVYNERVNAFTHDSKRSYEANIMVPQETGNLEDFVSLQERLSKGKIEMPSQGAVITEKLSNLLGIEVGDSFSYRDTDNITYEIEVAAIAENYLSHYIYMSPEYYDQVTLKRAKYNAGIFNIGDRQGF